MDKRIIKTKRNLKQTLVSLLNERPFDKIAVTDICARAETARGTFYTYYDDKYDLLCDFFLDFQNEIERCYLNLRNMRQKIDNAASLQCFVEAMVDTSTQYPFLSNPINLNLSSLYLHNILSVMNRIEETLPSPFHSAYPQNRLNAFLVMGFWGYLHIDAANNIPKLKKEACQLVQDLLNSAIFHAL